MQDRLDVLIPALRTRIAAIDAGLLDRSPPSEAIRLLDATPERGPYARLDTPLVTLLDGLGARGGPVSSAYHQLLLLELLRDRGDRLTASAAFTPTIRTWFVRNFARVLDDSAQTRQPESFYHHREDKFMKDLGVCSGRVIPAGAQKINRIDLPLGAVKRETPLRIARAAWCLARMGGRGPVFDMHTDSHDSDLMAEFTPEGWRRFYLNVAELMALHPEVRGLYGIGWFFDPVVATISPRLAYLNELVAESGGQLFRVGPNEGARESALATSPTRRELHAAGRYDPTDYMALWDRRTLMKWAAAARSAA